MNQQMSNMNLGPPKSGAPQQPPQNFPPQQQQFNNFPPTNGVPNGLPPQSAPQSAPQGANRMPPSQFPQQPIQQVQPTSAAPGFPPLQQQPMPPNQSFGLPPTSMGSMSQPPMATGQRPPIPGQNSFAEQNSNGLNGQSARAHTPQPQQQQALLSKPPGMGMGNSPATPGMPPGIIHPQQQQQGNFEYDLKIAEY